MREVLHFAVLFISLHERTDGAQAADRTKKRGDGWKQDSAKQAKTNSCRIETAAPMNDRERGWKHVVCRRVQTACAHERWVRVVIETINGILFRFVVSLHIVVASRRRSLYKSVFGRLYFGRFLCVVYFNALRWCFFLRIWFRVPAFSVADPP